MAAVLKIPINFQLIISILTILSLILLVYFLNKANQKNIDFFNIKKIANKEDKMELQNKHQH